MGNICPSLCPSSTSKASSRENTEHEVILANDMPFTAMQVDTSQQKKSKDCKILLLGAGDSGKSTFFRQLKLAYENGFSDEERTGYAEMIHAHIVKGICCLATWATRIGALSEEIMEALRPFYQFVESPDKTFLLLPEHGVLLSKIWLAPEIQEAWNRRQEQQQASSDCLLDHLEYYCENLERISRAGYIPTTTDILKVRAKTTGVVQLHFQQSNINFTVVDVGGQRAERRKWQNALHGVDVLLFFAPLCEFDQVLFEDASTNRMTESLHLFQQIVASEHFKNSVIILIFNKSDLFRKRVECGADLCHCFPDYDGAKTADGYVQYVREKFLNLNAEDKKIFINLTNSTDAADVQMVFNSIKQIVMLTQDSRISMETTTK